MGPSDLGYARVDATLIVDEFVAYLNQHIAMRPLNGGPLEHAAIREEFPKMLVVVVRDAGDGLLFTASRAL